MKSHQNIIWDGISLALGATVISQLFHYPIFYIPCGKISHIYLSNIPKYLSNISLIMISNTKDPQQDSISAIKLCSQNET